MGIAATKEERLHEHARKGEVEELCAVLDAGEVDVNCADGEGNTALHKAFAEDAVACAKVLLKRGAKISAGDSYGFTPLHRAVQCDAVQCVKVALEREDGLRLVNLTNQHGTTPLHWAAVWGSVDCAKLLLEAGADRNAQQRNGQTALHLAASNNSKETVHVLLAAGASTSIKDNYGALAVDMAAHAEIKEIIREGGDKAIASRPVWTPDYASDLCTACGKEFSLVVRRHHCRRCGRLFCGDCTSQKGEVANMGFRGKVRLCDGCFRSHDRSTPSETAREGDGDDDSSGGGLLRSSDGEEDSSPSSHGDSR